MTYDAQASADRLAKPLLMVGSKGMALPAGAEAYESRLAKSSNSAILKKVWLRDDVTQFDIYDRVDVVAKAADAVSKFLA